MFAVALCRWYALLLASPAYQTTAGPGGYQQRRIPYAPRQSRLNWIHDVRTVFEKYKIGWAMWECDEGFGWISYPSGNRNSPVADNEVLTSLGLK